ncbi:MAG TPA: DEDD exonuclease domain-containing protein [Egibacteraceae bacterium]
MLRATTSPGGPGGPRQPRLDDLGPPLAEVTFVVVDLETTGGSPADCRITEIGAVKVRGGELLGEFATLVDPGVAIPPSITALTGITTSMVADRPPIDAVLPAFLEFARGATLVAHNAGFDIGFLNANLERLAYPRLDHPVVCTATLARRLVRDEVRDCRLATLAQLFATRTVPVHRALADARATVEVFHALLERAGSFGVLTLPDLLDFAKVRNTPLFKARRGLADGLPQAPGVYAFRSASGEVLYVGKATDLRARVRSYFGSDDRRKVVDLLKESAAVDHWVCPTPLEAAVREVRLIQRHRPRFNRRSKTPERSVYLKLTKERFPRLSIVARPRADGATYLGPLASRRTAEQVADAIHEVVPLRRCSARIGPRTRFPACALAEMGRCLAPCDGSVAPEAYAVAVETVARAVYADPEPLLAPLRVRMRTLAAKGRFEDAAALRDRLSALVEGLARSRRLRDVAAPTLLVASAPARGGRREVVAVTSGRLVASASVPAAEVETAVAELAERAAAEVDDTPEARLPGRPVAPEDAEEVALVGRWLEQPGVVVHRCDGVLASAWAGGRALQDLASRLARARRATGRPDAELADKRVRRAPRGAGRLLDVPPATVEAP